MLVSPGAKINLGLYITGRRPDGYHDLLTAFYPLPLSDSLEIVLSGDTPDPSADVGAGKSPPVEQVVKAEKVPGLPLQFSASGIPVGGELNSNLCIKAYQMLYSDYPQLPAMSMHLHKVVPTGAGLGGGSADGALAIKVMNQLGELNLPETELLAYAAKLGSDCPFFIRNTPQLATGRGEILSPLAVSLTGYRLVLVTPHIHIPTRLAFSQIEPSPGPGIEKLSATLKEGPASWKETLNNQFETSVFQSFPVLKKIKDQLYELGASYASMTGSGSAIYALFDPNEPCNTSQLNHYQLYTWIL